MPFARSTGLRQGVSFDLPDEYRVEKIVGQGAYGVVCRAIHEPTKTSVAIKRIAPFDHRLTGVRTLREIKLLRHFQHENIVSILDLPAPRDPFTTSTIYVVQEFMPIDLNKALQIQELSDQHCQYFVYQLLRGLKAIHSAGVLHRDIKPANLLINEQCDLKICDFGLAREQTALGDGGNSMTEYVATRWYRAPEIMVNLRKYTSAIDMWSVGCVLAEMLSRNVLFPGRDYVHQLTLIFNTLGSPTTKDYATVESPQARAYIRSLPRRAKVPWDSIFPEACGLALNLLDQLLVFDPRRRLSADDALKHPYVAVYHDPADEPAASPIAPDLLAFDKKGRRPDLEQANRR